MCPSRSRNQVSSLEAFFFFLIRFSPACSCYALWFVWPGVKPATVLYGRSLPEEFFTCLAQDKAVANVLLVMGTSLTVYPAVRVPDYSIRLDSVHDMSSYTVLTSVLTPVLTSIWRLRLACCIRLCFIIEHSELQTSNAEIASRFGVPLVYQS